MPQAVASPSQFQANSFLNPVRVRRMQRSLTGFKGLISISKYEMASPKGSSRISTTSSSQRESSRFVFVAQDRDPGSETVHGSHRLPSRVEPRCPILAFVPSYSQPEKGKR